MEKTRAEKWRKGIAYELAFWNNVYRWTYTFRGMMDWSHYGGTIDLELFDANAFLLQHDHPLVLDVGCGMSYATGNYLCNGVGLQELNIHYVDPLADGFNKILKRHKRDLPLIEFGMMEYLSAFYPDSNVALVIIQNALDHSSGPVSGIVEALRVLKVGGVLYLNHHPNEAVTERYKGFHQFNIIEEKGQLVVWNQRERIVVDNLIGSFTRMQVKTHDNGHVVAVIEKMAEVPANIYDDFSERKQLCLNLMDSYQGSVSVMRVFADKLRYWFFNTGQFFVQALPWSTKMKLKKILKV